MSTRPRGRPSTRRGRRTHRHRRGPRILPDQGSSTITTTTTGQALHEERLAVLHLMRRHQLQGITPELVDHVARIILTMKGE